MIGILDYGAGNLRSVQKAFERLGERAAVSSDCTELNGCDKLVLPGVGSFGAGIARLRESGLADYLTARVSDTPLLGICLGMQFLLEESEEEGLHAGLGLVKGRVVPFTQGKVPHTGWNGVTGSGRLFCGIPAGTQFYFVHSYFADTQEVFTIGKTEYHRTFASAVCAGNAYGVQFHPEKSGDAGLQLLENFLRL
ncbi:MAG: imidazole glycerol phosphate synthase subunit HisH [Clostridia bacterium]|nr:imidazole glycerol phosphate synthase subunit HisH [Clostridia bacterium]